MSRKSPLYEFAIKKEVLFSGKEIYSPVVRRKNSFIQDEWQRISCIYGRYTTIEIDWQPELTHEECLQHIEGYKKELKLKYSLNLRAVEYQQLEDFSS